MWLWDAEEASFLEFEFAEPLVAVCHDQERNDEDEDGGSGDPRRLASAFHELLRYEYGVGGDLSASRRHHGDDGGLSQLRDYATVDVGFVLHGDSTLWQGDSAFSWLGSHGNLKRVGG